MSQVLLSVLCSVFCVLCSVFCVLPKQGEHNESSSVEV